ncbi:MAG: CvpA family protein [Flavobacteriia bacterium]|nr:CvpA family protein [Flavobacteriia bacterium]
MFSLIDLFFIVPLIYAAYQGYKKGFILHFFTLLALFAGLYVSIYFSDWVHNKITKTFELKQTWPFTISFVLCFLAVGAMVFFAGKALEKIVKITMLSPLNKLAGSIFSVLKTAFILSGIIYFIALNDKEAALEKKEIIQNSFLYRPLKGVLLYSIPKYKESKLDTLLDKVKM